MRNMKKVNKQPKFYSFDEFRKIINRQERFVKNRFKAIVKIINDSTGENLITSCHLSTLRYSISADICLMDFADYNYEREHERAYYDKMEFLRGFSNHIIRVARINLVDYVYDPKRDEELKQKIKDEFQKYYADYKDKDKLIQNALNKLTREEKISLGLSECG